MLVNAACDANAKAKGFKSAKASHCEKDDAGLTTFQCLAITKNNQQVSMGSYKQYFSFNRH